MAAGAVFILIIVLVVLAILGGGVYAIAAWLRHRQLAPEGDKLQDLQEPERPQRPEHLEVKNEQRTRFVGNR